MVILATFEGEDKLGYRRGVSYTLIVKGMWVMRQDGTGRTQYTNLPDFLCDWKRRER